MSNIDSLKTVGVMFSRHQNSLGAGAGLLTCAHLNVFQIETTDLSVNHY